MKDMYALVGNWFYRPAPKGLSVFKVDAQSGKLEFQKTYFDDCGIGTQTANPAKHVTYLVHECEAQRGCIGGGGYVMTVQTKPENGEVELLKESKTLSAFPSFFCLDPSGKYGVATHMGNGSHVTKIMKSPSGDFANTVVYDDAALVLFRMEENGCVGDICDVYVKTGDERPGAHSMSHMHSVSCDRQGRIFFVCDKGTDKVYTFTIDREKEKLIALRELKVEDNVIPRYSVFHPTLPLVYSNNERLLELFTYHVDFETGAITRTARTGLLMDPGVDQTGLRVEPADLIWSPDCKHLYVTIRGLDLIAVLDVDADGALHLRQNVHTQPSPRGLCFLPDGRFLYCMNTESATIETFAVDADGMLTPAQAPVSAPSPACMSIVCG